MLLNGMGDDLASVTEKQPAVKPVFPKLTLVFPAVKSHSGKQTSSFVVLYYHFPPAMEPMEPGVLVARWFPLDTKGSLVERMWEMVVRSGEQTQ